MQDMIYVCVDESGNLGRGGKYFVFGAVVFRDECGKKRLKNLIKRQCLSLSSTSRPLAEIKANQLSFPQKQKILELMVKRPDFDVYYLVLDKTNFNMLKMGRDKNLVYNYLAGYLIRHIAMHYNDNINVVFDRRSTKVASMNSLSDYIRTKLYSNPGFRYEILVHQKDSKSEYNLQTADIIGGAIYGAYTRQSRHFLDILSNRIEGAIEFPYASFDGKLIDKRK